MTTDRFGNDIDSRVGYARGALLGGSADEVRRLAQAGRVAADFVAREGIDKIAICTGNLRFFPVTPDDLPLLCEEWIGPDLFSEELRLAAIAHLGGQGHEAAAVVNRTSAGIVATILAHGGGRPVLSLVPEGDRSHASVTRGARLAGVEVMEVHDLGGIGQGLLDHAPALTIITPVTSELAMLPDDLIRDATAKACAAKSTVLLDDAYGARFRPVLHDGAPSLSFGPHRKVSSQNHAKGERMGTAGYCVAFLIAL